LPPQAPGGLQLLYFFADGGFAGIGRLPAYLSLRASERLRLVFPKMFAAISFFVPRSSSTPTHESLM
jgi:hypothetical protein